MSNKIKPSAGLGGVARRARRSIRCPECGGGFGRPYQQSDGTWNADLEHAAGCPMLVPVPKIIQGGTS